MRRIVVLVVIAIGLSTVAARHAHAAPTIEIDPAIATSGTLVEVKGAGFGSGVVSIHIDEVDPAGPLATDVVARDGTILVRFEVPSLKLGGHLVLACRDLQRSGECRELAEAPVEIVAPPTTTTQPSTTTTTPRTTTTVPRTTTTTPRTTTTVPRTTTTTPRTTTTVPRTTTTTPRTTTTPPSTAVGTATPVELTTTTSPAAVFGTTTTQVGGLAAPSTTLGGDPIPPPLPVNDLAVATTTAGPALATPDDVVDVDITVTGIEVTQGLQNLANDFPLVANRPTAVRLFGTSAGNYAGAVSGWLEVSRGGISSGLIPAENNPVQFTNVPIRYDNDFAPYFLVNPNWIAPGEVTFRGVVFAGDPTHANDTNPADNEIQVTLEFHEAEQVRVHMFPLHLTDNGTSSGGTLAIHTAEDGWTSQTQAMRRLWPVADIVFDPYNPVVGGPEAGWDLTEDGSLSDPFPLLSLIQLGNFGPFADYDLVMGMVSPDVPTEFGGGAKVPGKVSWAKMRDLWSPDWPWHNVAAGIIAQELGHNAGLSHAPCDYTPGDPLPGELHGGAVDPLFPQSYSWPNCSIGPQDPEGFYGFDVQYYSTPTAEPSIMTNDPESEPPLSAVSFMSYAGKGKWYEPWHGCQLLAWLGVPCDPYDLIDIDDDTPGQGQGTPNPASGVPVWSCDSWDGPFSDDDGLCDLMPTQPFDPVALDTADSDIVIQAQIDPVLGTADVSPTWELEDVLVQSWKMDGTPNLDLTLRDYGEDHFVVLLDADSKVLGAQSIDVASAVGSGHTDEGHTDDDSGNPLLGRSPSPTIANVALRIPRPVDLDRIVIVNASGVIAELAPGRTEPVIESFDVELDGEIASITWSARDDDGDPVSALVRFGPEGARRVLTTSQAVEGDGDGSATVDLSMLPGGKPGRIELIVTDGLHQASALSSEIELPDRAPHATMLSPADGSTRRAGQLVLLDGMVVDAEDGSDLTVVWTSDLDGELGTGSTVGTYDLRAGRHRITMTVVDAAGNSVSESRAIVIAPADPGVATEAIAVADLFANGPTERGDGTRWMMFAAILAAIAVSLALVVYLFADRFRSVATR